MATLGEILHGLSGGLTEAGASFGVLGSNRDTLNRNIGTLMGVQNRLYAEDKQREEQERIEREKQELLEKLKTLPDDDFYGGLAQALMPTNPSAAVPYLAKSYQEKKLAEQSLLSAEEQAQADEAARYAIMRSAEANGINLGDVPKDTPVEVLKKIFDNLVKVKREQAKREADFNNRVKLEHLKALLRAEANGDKPPSVAEKKLELEQKKKQQEEEEARKLEEQQRQAVLKLAAGGNEEARKIAEEKGYLPRPVSSRRAVPPVLPDSAIPPTDNTPSSVEGRMRWEQDKALMRVIIRTLRGKGVTDKDMLKKLAIETFREIKARQQ